jgi:uncharacterized membrane protein (UPF0127 family)
MRIIRIQNVRSGAILGQNVQLAECWWRRAVGLLGQTELPEGSGILLVPCASVHTLGMRFPVDVAFLDGRGRIVETRADMPPGHFAVGGQDVHATLELPVGTLAATDTRHGDTLILEESRP